MSLTCFLYNERLDEQILVSQVFNLWHDYLKNNDDIVEIVIFQNLFYYIQNYSIQKKIKKEFTTKQLKISFYPFALPTKGFFLTPFFIFVHKNLFFFTQRFLNYNVVLSRGYIASFLVSSCKELNYKTKFSDLRSLFVRENVDVRWKANSSLHKFWLNNERIIVENSFKVISVNKSMQEHLIENHSKFNSKFIVIPIYSRSYSLPNKNNFDLSNEIKLVYVGSLGLSKWNDASVYSDFFKEIRNKTNYKIFKITLIIKNKNPQSEALENHLTRLGLNFNIYYNLKHKYVQKILRNSDVGLILSRPFSDSSSRTGIKTVEYLSNNLIIWASSCLTEVSSMIRKNNLGLIVPNFPLSKNDIDSIVNGSINKNIFLKKNISAYYNQNFSAKKILYDVKCFFKK